MHNRHMKVIYFGKEAWEEAYIKNKLPGVGVTFYLGAIGQYPEARDGEAEVISIFVNSPVGAVEMGRFPKLRLIATRSTGTDHIDAQEAKKRGVAVASVPGYGAPTVAEFAFALILALSRKVCDAHKQVTETGSFSQNSLTGFDLAGKTIGVVGCGKIGQHTARIAKGFGMRVLVSDSFKNEALAKEIGFAYAELPELLGKSDVISLHVPYMKETHHLISMSNIGQIKKGAYLVNTARGAVVETAALVKALEDGILAGAGLDVLEEEGDMQDEMHLLSGPHPKEEELKIVLENHYLIDHPRVIITPHIAFDTREAIERILDTTVENIVAFNTDTPKDLL